MRGVVTIHLRWISVSPIPTHHCYFLQHQSGIQLCLANLTPVNDVDQRSPSLHRVVIILVHKPHSQSVCEQIPLELTGLCPFPLLFTIYVDNLLGEFEDDTIVSVYTGGLATYRSTHNKDVIIASNKTRSV